MKKLLFLLVSGICTVTFAQHDAAVSVLPEEERKTVRENHIQSFSDYFFVWPVLKQRRLDFDVRGLSGNKPRLQFKSNKAYSVGVGFYLFELAVEVAFATSLDEQNKRIYGESDSRDLQLNMLGKKWGIDAYYQGYKGFYQDDPKVRVPANTPYPQRPDVRATNVGLAVNYTFNHNRFSFRSAYNFSERQLKSTGSLVVFGSINRLSVSGDSAIIGDGFPGFGELSDIIRVKSFLTGIAPGYTYSLIYRGFFLNGTLAIGPAFNRVSYEQENSPGDTGNRFSSLLIGRLAMGYNGDRLFGGLTFYSQGKNARFEEIELSATNSSFRILLGYRFKETGVLKKRVTDIPKEIFR
jgi:hypothetical protein